MLNFIWCFIVIFSVICSIFTGKADDLSKAFTDSTADAMTLLITLAGIIVLCAAAAPAVSAAGQRRRGI